MISYHHDCPVFLWQDSGFYFKVYAYKIIEVRTNKMEKSLYRDYTGDLCAYFRTIEE